jgi:Ni,Fe-hydrogenase III large subunit
VTQIPVSTAEAGDVLARAFVRGVEAQRSLAFVGEGLRTLPEGPLLAEVGPLAGDALALAVTEGWRGEIWHVALTDSAGRFARYKVVDPSFHNWMGLALAMRGEAISDFPLCNKSFNLSYCGFDL